jgi:hypothetical protein
VTVDLPTILGLVSTLAIVAGLVFAGFQVRMAQRERSKDSQMLLAANAFFNAEFMRGVQVILDLPDGLTRPELVAHLQGDESRIYNWLGSMEGIGFLVFHHAVPLDIVAHGASGPIILSWRKLQGYVREERARVDRETMWEWFQWLAERLLEREAATPRIAAHMQHRDWQP